MCQAVVLTVGCLLQYLSVATGEQCISKPCVFYAVEMEGGAGAARALAQQHGVQFISQIGSLEDHFTLKDTRGHHHRDDLETQLSNSAGVRWVQRQQTHYRDKRSIDRGLGHSTAHLQSRDTETQTLDLTQTQTQDEDQYQNQEQGAEEGQGQPLIFNDPLWPMQWELYKQGQYSSSVFDLNVMPVWRRNISGRGVVVTIIDDGVDHTNRDLRRNYEAAASLNLRGSHGLSHDPMPFRDEENGHGTRCAGEVAMEANNSYCGVGIAFNARIGGIRLLDGEVTDAMEAASLSYASQLVDLYVCSWGPRDNGREMAGPGRLAQQALRLGTLQGRGGQGNIFVWASGNGGMADDHCGADGYVNNIHSVAIGAVTHSGSPAYFGEACPGIMAVTLTGGSQGRTLPLVTVSNLGDGCVTHFAGTSSAAPIAAGILALVLEANPDLTWRDVQHLIAMTAKVPDPKQPGWTVNGAGYHVHHRFGFGVLDAALMVQQALLFKSVAPHRECTEEVTFDPARILPSGGEVRVIVQSDGCLGTDAEVDRLEHVQVCLSLSSVCRGDLSVELESPMGTVSMLLAPRANDDWSGGLRNWTLMTVHCWGEHPRGPWALKVTDHRGTVEECVREGEGQPAGALLSLTLTLYGSSHPHRPPQERPQPGVVSMGEFHPIPQEGLFVRDRAPPLDLIHWAFQLERRRKVGPADIPALRHRKNSKVRSWPVASISPEDLDDTDGAELGAHLKQLWNSLRNRLQKTWRIYRNSTMNSPQFSWEDVILKRFLSARMSGGEEPLDDVRNLRGEVGGPSRFSLPRDLIEIPRNRKRLRHDRKHLLQALMADVKEMQRLQKLLPASRERRG